MSEDFLHQDLPEGNRDEIGIKLARDLESIDDERVLWKARLDVKEKMLEDYREVIYYLASRTIDNRPVTSVEAWFDANDKGPVEIDRPKQKRIHHAEVRFEV